MNQLMILTRDYWPYRDLELFFKTILQNSSLTFDSVVIFYVMIQNNMIVNKVIHKKFFNETDSLTVYSTIHASRMWKKFRT